MCLITSACMTEEFTVTISLPSLPLSSQGYWVFFVMKGNGPLYSIYKALHVLDFYLGFIIPCHPILGMDVSVITGYDL